MSTNPMFLGDFEEADNLFADNDVVREYKEHFVAFLDILGFKHTIQNKDLGTIGIIGPKRMNYSKVISVMKYISKKLNENKEQTT